MDALFSKINSGKSKKCKSTIKVSFVEIHNEDLIDLLSEGEYESKPQVMIREDTKGSIILSGLQEIKVNNEDEVMRYICTKKKKEEKLARIQN